MEPKAKPPSLAAQLGSLLFVYVAFGLIAAAWIHSEYTWWLARQVDHALVGQIAEVDIETLHQIISGKRIAFDQARVSVETEDGVDTVSTMRDYMVEYCRSLNKGDDVTLEIGKDGKLAGIVLNGQVLVEADHTVVSQGLTSELFFVCAARVVGPFCILIMLLGTAGMIIRLRTGPPPTDDATT